MKEIMLRLQQQGVKLSLSDVAYWIERSSPQRARNFLSYALDLVRPFSAGLGVFCRFQTDDEIVLEMKLRPRNKSSEGDLHSGAVIGAAIEACELMLDRHGPVNGFSYQIKEQSATFEKRMVAPIFLNFEWPPAIREKMFMKMQKEKMTEAQFEILMSDKAHKSIGKVLLTYEFKYRPRLQISEKTSDKKSK